MLLLCRYLLKKTSYMSCCSVQEQGPGPPCGWEGGRRLSCQGAGWAVGIRNAIREGCMAGGSGLQGGGSNTSLNCAATYSRARRAIHPRAVRLRVHAHRHHLHMPAPREADRSGRVHPASMLESVWLPPPLASGIAWPSTYRTTSGCLCRTGCAHRERTFSDRTCRQLARELRL